MKLLIITGLTLGLSAPIAAQNEPPQLSFPVDCTLGKNCWIARYVDRRPGPDKADYQCKPQTENKHNGTDIAIRDFGVMKSGVAVRAAAAGRVLALRDGMPDIIVTKKRRAEIQKQGCGNVLIIGHGNGWRTRYCHLKNDSLLVEKGDEVVAGQAIAQVGLSGLTEFPHLHFMVQRKQQGKPIQHYDPFDGGLFESGCNAAVKHDQKPFWKKPINYAGPIIMPPLVSDARATRRTLWQAQADQLPGDISMLFIQARGFHTLPGDIWRFSLIGPGGKLRFAHDVEQTSRQQLVGANANFKSPDGGFSVGTWVTRVNMQRNGVMVGSAQSSISITSDQK